MGFVFKKSNVLTLVGQLLLFCRGIGGNDVVYCLLFCQKGNTPLHTAALAGTTSVAKILIDAGSNVNAQSQVQLTDNYRATQSARS